jgi:nicotinamide mononucleotide transporter
VFEWIAFITGVLQVILAYANRRLNFYAGIISVSLYMIVFYNAGLYAESLLNLYYVFISIAGLILWQQQHIRDISHTTKAEIKKAFLLTLFLWITLVVVLRQFTQSDIPMADALVTAIAWTGSWLLLKRKVENWLVLNLSNLIAVPLHIYKGLELTAILTCIYIFIAMKGYFEWRKKAVA